MCMGVLKCNWLSLEVNPQSKTTCQRHATHSTFAGGKADDSATTTGFLEKKDKRKFPTNWKPWIFQLLCDFFGLLWPSVAHSDDISARYVSNNACIM